MSPEQASGSGDVDGRSDVYALGCVLFEMLGGRPPFVGPTPDNVLRQHVVAEPPDIAGLRSNVSDQLRAVVQKALAKVPADRFETVARYAEAVAHPDSVSAVPRKSHGRRLGRRLITALAVAIGVILVFWYALQPGDADVDSSVIVLPARNLTGNASHASLSETAAERTISGLAKVPDVQAIPFVDIMNEISGVTGSPSSNTEAAARRLAERLRVRFLVTPSYSLQGDSLVFHTTILDRSDGTTLPPPRPAKGLLADQSSVIDSLMYGIMGAIGYYAGATFPPNAGYVRTPPSWHGFQAYHAGMVSLERFDLRAAERALKTAVALDPGFTEPWFSLVPIFGQQRFAELDSLASAMELAIPDMTDGDRSVYDFMKAHANGNRGSAYRAACKTTEHLTTGAEFFQCGFHAMAFNEPAVGERNLLRYDPDSWFPQWVPYWYFLTMMQHAQGKYEEELESAKLALRVVPVDDWRTLGIPARVALGHVTTVDELLLEQLSRGPNDYLVMRTATELRAHGHQDASDNVLNRYMLQSFSVDSMGDINNYRLQEIADALSMVDRPHDAYTVLMELHNRLPNAVNVLGRLGVAATRLGDLERVTRIDSILSDDADRPYALGRPTVWRARIAAVLGDSTGAIRNLREAVRQGAMFHDDARRVAPGARKPGMISHDDPDFEHLRGFGDFYQFMKPKG